MRAQFQQTSARVIPDSGSSPSRDPEHFSGSRLGILPLQEPPTQDPEALDPDSGWIPTRESGISSTPRWIAMQRPGIEP
eukprot:COSAG05_NODE_15092_length_378_cov_1.856631_1_plen_78_part_10